MLTLIITKHKMYVVNYYNSYDIFVITLLITVDVYNPWAQINSPDF